MNKSSPLLPGGQGEGESRLVVSRPLGGIGHERDELLASKQDVRLLLTLYSGQQFVHMEVLVHKFREDRLRETAVVITGATAWEIDDDGNRVNEAMYYHCNGSLNLEVTAQDHWIGDLLVRVHPDSRRSASAAGVHGRNHP